MSLSSEWLLMKTADGRDLEVAVSGPDSGFALVSITGTPSAALPFPALVEAAASRGLRTIDFSRPGYAKSSPQHGRSVADVAVDIATILDAVGAPRFVTMGRSGGGPHALACAALLPERCLAAACIAGVAPYPADGLDWLAGMGDENIEEFTLAIQGEAALTPYLERYAKDLAEVQASEVAAAFGSLISDVDKASLIGEFAEHSAASLRRSVSTGIAGWRDDDLAFSNPWGFELGDITVPVAVWQGGQDRMVPRAHGEWLAAHIPGARAHRYPAEGHLSLELAAVDDILDDLMALAGVSS
jgi:pimeloyl-ACP methyl ester carboxylesterase